MAFALEPTAFTTTIKRRDNTPASLKVVIAVCFLILEEPAWRRTLATPTSSHRQPKPIRPRAPAACDELLPWSCTAVVPRVTGHLAGDEHRRGSGLNGTGLSTHARINASLRPSLSVALHPARQTSKPRVAPLLHPQPALIPVLEAATIGDAPLT